MGRSKSYLNICHPISPVWRLWFNIHRVCHIVRPMLRSTILIKNHLDHCLVLFHIHHLYHLRANTATRVAYLVEWKSACLLVIIHSRFHGVEWQRIGKLMGDLKMLRKPRLAILAREFGPGLWADMAHIAIAS